ncbi:gas vesicle protein [Streptomyces agglomeratus]|uniref:gas vesicle protein n=1 Tax=Streptomyces agglomeratus TaxID=285458 RepID=UPI000AA93D2E
MSEPAQSNFGSFPSRAAPSPSGQGSSANLADILERVLDKGIVIAGDIQINLLDIELLTVKLRLLVVSVDKAKEMGIDWWEHDPSLSSRAAKKPDLVEENRLLRDEIAALREAQALPASERRSASRTPERPRREELPASEEVPASETRSASEARSAPKERSASRASARPRRETGSAKTGRTGARRPPRTDDD